MTRVAAVGEIADGTSKHVEVDGEELAIVNAGGVYYAIGDVCSHEYFLLSGGEVDVDNLTIECPKHGSAFSLETGAALTLPAIMPVRTYGVRVVGEDILVEPLNQPREATG